LIGSKDAIHAHTQTQDLKYSQDPPYRLIYSAAEQETLKYLILLKSLSKKSLFPGFGSHINHHTCLASRNTDILHGWFSTNGFKKNTPPWHPL